MGAHMWWPALPWQLRVLAVSLLLYHALEAALAAVFMRLTWGCELLRAARPANARLSAPCHCPPPHTPQPCSSPSRTW